ncbi:TPA: common pilus major fimbrillin subunit EcpA [Proteus mirabilis]|uniref:common pilus major fimbrillin subunit EcpA n=1 Tax=Proteus mirabilis TaxID=584 RepID=UPI00073C105D|nr:common pilus major fimbrillin subunit EcpA [Proteus mirabilis]AZH00300.1 fimbrial protein [Proteus mirabilis]KSY00594.1 fimbrial protein [Proteus mirabilis]MBG2990727.1 common pilus major fimbrillin subunit EcpA [Proteus mirabilis]MBG6040922.1 common pilus major fimbrillin subunit EcpA [Proteus mirabilis]MBS3852450.1 common pilus major fimbrillin subunit EcpA [Proteus mirabilis]
MLNKKIASVMLSTIIAASFATAANADTRVAQATATWQATAIKDTTSMLVVTPLKSLTFNYAEGQKSFNQQNGAFDIAIQGQSGATDFKLSSKLIANTLARTTDDSTLTVGVKWNGEDLSKTTDVVLIDTSKGLTSGLDNLAADGIYNGSERATDRGEFTFVIAGAQAAGATADFKSLADGVWDGDVKVQFTATWDGDFSPVEPNPEP